MSYMLEWKWECDTGNVEDKFYRLSLSYSITRNKMEKKIADR